MARKRKKPENLTQKEFMCLELYIKYGNAKQAAEEAGYSKKTAGTQGCRLINSEKGQAYLAERLEDSDNKAIADANEVMEYLTSVMRGEIQDQFDIEPSLAERTKAAQELAKRLVDKSTPDTSITIINDIPNPIKETKKRGRGRKKKEEIKK